MKKFIGGLLIAATMLTPVAPVFAQAREGQQLAQRGDGDRGNRGGNRGSTNRGGGGDRGQRPQAQRPQQPQVQRQPVQRQRDAAPRPQLGADGMVRQRKPLVIRRATADELVDHERVLAAIDKESKGACVWLPKTRCASPRR